MVNNTQIFRIFLLDDKLNSLMIADKWVLLGHENLIDDFLNWCVMANTAGELIIDRLIMKFESVDA